MIRQCLASEEMNFWSVIHDRVLSVLVLTGLCLGLCGCGDAGPRRVAVSGTVLVDGAPLPKGAVQFAPADNTGPLVSVTVESGKFEVPESIGPLAGTSLIDVLVIRDLGFDLDDDAAYAQAVRKSRRPLSPTPAQPPVFADASQRTVELSSNRTDLCFQLQTPGKRRGR
jgi:hypothetical protein